MTQIRAIVEFDFETRSSVPISNPEYYTSPLTEVTEAQWCVRDANSTSPVRLWSPFGMFVLDHNTLNMSHVPPCEVLAQPCTNAYGVPQELYEMAADPGVLFAAFNHKFEKKIWANVMVKRFGMPEIPDERWICRAEQSRWCGGPGKLEDAAAFWSRGRIRKTDQKALKQIMAPLPDGTWCTDRQVWLEMWRYGAQDIPAQMAVDSGCLGLHPAIHGQPHEREYLRVNGAMNERGIPVVREILQPAIDLAEYGKAPLIEECQRLTADFQQLLFDTGRAKDSRKVRDGGPGKNKPAAPADGIRPTQREQILMYLTDVHGYPHEKLGKDLLQPWMEEHEEHSPAYRVSMARLLSAKAASSKYEAARDRTTDDDHFVRDALLIFGAHTRRSSSIGLQAQNFFKSSDSRLTEGNEQYDELVAWAHSVLAYPHWTLEQKSDTLCNYFGLSLPEILANLLRGMIRAPQGYRMVGADYAAIEARIVFWLANCDTATNAFATGADIYCEAAGGVFQRQLTKADPERNKIGKPMILGLGFGMGLAKFTGTLAEDYQQYAKQAVDGYHTLYPEIKDLHNQFDCAAIAVFSGQRDRVRLATCDITFERLGEHVRMTLPSGGHIIYPFAKAVVDPDGYQWYKYRIDENGRLRRKRRAEKGDGWVMSYWSGWSPKGPIVKSKGVWGGMFTENACQSLAGDIMFLGSIQVARDGRFAPFLPIHDELLTLLPEGLLDDETAVRELERLLVPYADWMVGPDNSTLPLDAEGWAGLSFRK